MASDERKTATGHSRTDRIRRTRRFSPIRRRILAVNVLALAIAVAGTLYQGEYRENLINAEIGNLHAQADMFAAALGEGAVGGQIPMDQELVRETANRIVRRMVESTDSRARLFRTSGQLVADSRNLLHAGRNVEVEVLAPPHMPSRILRSVFGLYDRVAGLVSGRKEYAKYIENPHQHARHYPEVMDALLGRHSSAVWTLEPEQLVLTASVPVQRYKQVLGAIMVSKSSQDIDQALYEVRLNIVRIFLVTLSVTLFLSFYLAGTIAGPILRLSAAADKIRHSLNRQYALPDLKARDDEIGDLALALRHMTDALWNRMDAIERFAADVSHEIKNPLTSLKSAVETAARVSDAAQQRKLLAIIQDDVERLDRLITDISDASRVDAELSRGELAQVDLGRIFETLADVHQSTTQATTGDERVKLVIEMNSDTPYLVPGMEDRLVQVFRNLIVNAMTFSPPDGQVIITLRHEKPGTKDHNFVVEIRDHGPGIQPGKEQAIFDRFYSERPVNEKFGTHSGLGLSISLQIIQAHNGTISAGNYHDSDGQVTGAVFTVSLPAINS